MKEISMKAFQKKVMLRRAEVQYNKFAETLAPELEAAGFSIQLAERFGESIFDNPRARLDDVLYHILKHPDFEPVGFERRQLRKVEPVRRLIALELGAPVLKSVMTQVSDPQDLEEKPIGWWSHVLMLANGVLTAESVFEEDKYAAYQFRQAVAP